MRRLALFSVAAILVLVLVHAQETGPAGLPTPPPGPGGGLSPYVTLPPPPNRSTALDKLTPVTDAQLVHPPETDWLTWRRTYDD